MREEKKWHGCQEDKQLCFLSPHREPDFMKTTISAQEFLQGVSATAKKDYDHGLFAPVVITESSDGSFCLINSPKPRCGELTITQDEWNHCILPFEKLEWEDIVGKNTHSYSRTCNRKPLPFLKKLLEWNDWPVISSLIDMLPSLVSAVCCSVSINSLLYISHLCVCLDSLQISIVAVCWAPGRVTAQAYHKACWCAVPRQHSAASHE